MPRSPDIAASGGWDHPGDTPMTPMTTLSFSEYQQQALRTAPADRTTPQNLANAALGLAGEAGEVADTLKKHLFHEHPLDVAAVAKEVGDVLWYCALLAQTLDLDLGQIADGNLAKLRARYPDGFDPARSRNRAEVAHGVGVVGTAG